MKVIAKQQSSFNPGSEPVEMKWCESANDTDVFLAVAQLMNHQKNNEPWAPVMLEIRIEF